ncbi:MAG: DsbA family protein [Pseudomonadota bacterium]
MLKTKSAIGAALAGAFLLGAIVVGYSAAQPKSTAPAHKAGGSFNELQEEEIGQIIRDYLMENPEVIIEAVNAYSAEQRLAEVERSKAAAANNLPRLLDASTAYVAGKSPDKAKVAVIEMYDYHCGYCKRAAGLVRELAKDDAEVKVVFRELPILREESDYAAEMALAAKEQGKFLDFHFALLEASGVLTKDRVHSIAEKHGLNVEKMIASIEDGAIPNMIETNYQMAQELGVDGTPAFIIASLNGDYIDVVAGFDPNMIQAKIDEAKQAAS